MISRRRRAVWICAVFGLGSLSFLISACSDVEVDPIVHGPNISPQAGAPLTHEGPMDVLFVVDDSSSMSDKQQYLSEMAGSFLNHLANPSCLDASQNVIGVSKSGTCVNGKPEFVAATDIHVGIVSTSLGIGTPEPNTLQCANFKAHLVSGTVTSKQPTLDATTQVFHWTSADGDVSRLVTDVSASVVGMGENGCGIESQLESWYRFLVQPDPYDHLAWADSQSTVQLVGIDDTLLAQRKAFLRPNSTVAVVMLTDENDSSLDPLALSGTAYELLQQNFSPPSPTSICATDPTSIACTSCAFQSASSDPNCASAPKADPDSVNVRLFHAKQRFGVDPQFPITRYSSALSSPRVPDRAGEHTALPPALASGDYVGVQDCDNPLFAAELPADSSGDVCNLGRGPRSANQVFFTVIAGVPHQLLQQDPTQPASPFKGTLSESDYDHILGADPIAYRFDGVDPHMIESLTPRAGIAPGDPIVLGDWDTKGGDLERACTFQLPLPLDEVAPFYGDCTLDPSDQWNDASGDPVCASDGSQKQLYAAATPAIREISVARALGYQAVVASICPVDVQIDSSGTTTQAITNTNGDPLFGYEPAATGLISRMAGK